MVLEIFTNLVEQFLTEGLFLLVILGVVKGAMSVATGFLLNFFNR